MTLTNQQMAPALCEQVYRRSGDEQQLQDNDEAFGDPLDTRGARSLTTTPSASARHLSSSEARLPSCETSPPDARVIRVGSNVKGPKWTGSSAMRDPQRR